MADRTCPVTVGDARYHRETGEIHLHGTVRRLRPQAARALDLLVARAGELVTREDLRKTIWPDTLVDFDLSINVCIRQIRAALEDDADTPRYIETLPRRGYRLIAPVGQTAPAASSGRWARWSAAAAATGIVLVTLSIWRPDPATTLAVLPFSTTSADDSLAYLREGVAEELITSLGGVAPRSLSVIARTSSFQLAREGLDPLAIGRRLEADYVLTGALRRLGTRYRATVQLLDVDRGRYVWAESYDLASADLFQVEKRIAEGVTGVLALRTPAEESGPDRVDPAARERLLRARYLLARATPADAERAVRQLEAARRIDSAYGDPLVELARAHLKLGNLDTAESLLAQASGWSPRPARLDEVAGQVALYGRAAPDRAVEILERAVRREPGNAEARRVYANALVASGRPRAAVRHAEAALRLDPVSSTVRGDVGWVHYYAGAFADADRVCRSTLELVPTSVSAHACVVLSAALSGQASGATTSVGFILSALSADHSVTARVMESTRRNDLTPLWRWLAELPPGAVDEVNRARVFTLLDRPDAALDAIGRAAGGGPAAVLFVRADPALRPLHRDPAFGALLPGGTPPAAVSRNES